MRFLPFVCVFLAGCHAAPKRTETHTVRSAPDLVRMDCCQLEALYRQCEVGTPPCGVLDGRAIINPGSPITVPASHVTRLLWQGKVIHGDTMINRVFGVRAVKAKAYIGESYVDGKPSLVLDYAETSKLFSKIRDEVREVSPGLWLGMAHERTPEGPEIKAWFTLTPR
jgi:hypothetical protein